MTTLTTNDAPTTTAAASAARRRTATTGRVLTGLLVTFCVIDAGAKVARFRFAVEATEALGFGDHHVVLIGALLALGLVLHLVPRTAFVGAVYLSAYFGGAVAAHVRTDNIASVVFTVVFAVLLWVGYALREPRVRALALR